MSEQCALCERRKEKTGEFCSLHKIALANLKHAYIIWSEAFGGLEKEKYYSELERHPETGFAVKEVIKHVRDKGTIA